MNKIKNLARIVLLIFPGLDWLLKFNQANSKSFISSNIIEKLWAYRKGFFLESIKICGITKQNYSEYLSDRTYLNLHPINKQYSAIIDNKLYLPFLLKDYPELVPEYYFYIDNGRLVNLDKELPDDQFLINLCKAKQKLALKPCSASLGKGFNVLEWKENSFFLNSKLIELTELDIFIKTLDKYLVTEYIKQSDYSSGINNSSVNTVRLICIRDKGNHKFFIALSYHRFGRKGRFVDNLGSEGGGLLAFIDIPTGKLKNIGLFKEEDKAEEVITVTSHPDSFAQVAGVEIPGWHNMKQKVLEVMNHLSFLRYAGLDVVITEDGFKINEINSFPALAVIQLEGGILKDDRLRSFFLEK